MKKFIKPLFTLLITIIFIGCGEKKKSRGLIGATCMNIANPFFKVIEESMRDEAAKHGYDLIYLGCEMDISKQQKQTRGWAPRTTTPREPDGAPLRDGGNDCMRRRK